MGDNDVLFSPKSISTESPLSLHKKYEIIMNWTTLCKLNEGLFLFFYSITDSKALINYLYAFWY